MKYSDDAPDGLDWSDTSGSDGKQTLASDAEGESERPSKSQLKREKQSLQALAERMARMPRSELQRLNLSPPTWAALEETTRIKDVRALKRHWKRIANLLERDDRHAVELLVEGAEARERAATARHHALEDWRTRLLGVDTTGNAAADHMGDAALGAFIDAYPQVDRQQLRALVRQARVDIERARPHAPRKLFRFLRETVEAADDPDPDQDPAPVAIPPSGV